MFVPVFMMFVLQLPHWVTEMFPALEAYNGFVVSYGYYIGAVFYIIASSTDGVDGYIARKRKQVTKLGIFLDPIADKLLVAAALIALVERYRITGDEVMMGVSGWAAMVIISREFIVTGLRLVVAGEGVVLKAGGLGKLKMVVQTVAISAALLGNFPLSLVTDFPFDALFMAMAVVVTVYSGVDYVVKNVRHINSKSG